MKPAAFTYLQPDTVEEAIDALQQHGDEARVLAGGQSLMAMLKTHHTSPIPSLKAARQDVPEEVEKVFRKLLAKSPADRYSTLADLIDLLAPPTKKSFWNKWFTKH